jgi:phosphate transport system substrate-binding protein
LILNPLIDKESEMKSLKAASFALAAALCGSSLFAQAVKVDAGIPSYQKTSGVSGNVSSVGSDTLNNLMTLWAEGFSAQYPNVKIEIEGQGGSGW